MPASSVRIFPSVEIVPIPSFVFDWLAPGCSAGASVVLFSVVFSSVTVDFSVVPSSVFTEVSGSVVSGSVVSGSVIFFEITKR